MKPLFFICLLSYAIATMAEEKNYQEILRDGNDKFTAKMFYEVAKSKPNQNVVLSAFSVLPPLAQLAFASVGESHDELLNAIGMPNDNVTKAVFSQVDSKLRSTKGITLNTASKIYIAEHFDINTDFAAVAKDTFGSEVKNINFGNSQGAVDEINGWVEDQTNKKIKKLVTTDDVDGNTAAVLVNAIYFKGAWKYPFNKGATSDRDFHVSKNKVVKVPTMYHKGDYKYGDSNELKAQILEIPYAGDESSFVVVLPHDIDGIEELEEKLKDPTVLNKATQNLQTVEVDLSLPKFKIETTIELDKVLFNLNVKKLFTPNEARLDHLLKNAANLHIDSAVQKAFIEVNEEGAEAAAANAFIVNYAETFPQQFVADRPFYFAVRANSLTMFNGVMREA